MDWIASNRIKLAATGNHGPQDYGQLGFNSRHLHYFYNPSRPFASMALLNVPDV